MIACKTALGAEFTDVPKSHWAYEVIGELSDKGVINGIGNSNYAPESALTKAQFMKLLTCALGDFDSDKKYEPMYLDTAEGEWYTPYVTCGIQNAITDKTSDFFYPDSAITRGEAVVWIVNGMGIQKDVVCSFSDVIDSKEKTAVAIAYDKGIISGYEDGSFRPDNTLTRAEAAVLISRIMKNAPKFGQLREDSSNEIVMKENVKYIEVGENNIIKKADKKQNTITFSYADETVKNLSHGDVIYISKGENNDEAIVKVTSVKKRTMT